jgi:hypothetical protein
LDKLNPRFKVTIIGPLSSGPSGHDNSEGPVKNPKSINLMRAPHRNLTVIVLARLAPALLGQVTPAQDRQTLLEELGASLEIISRCRVEGQPWPAEVVPKAGRRRTPVSKSIHLLLMVGVLACAAAAMAMGAVVAVPLRAANAQGSTTRQANGPGSAPRPAAAKQDLNVLFIGNSMTWFCNMPRTVAELAEKMDPPVRIHAALSCQACQTLPGHVKDGSPTRRAIAGDISDQRRQMEAEVAFLASAPQAKPDDALARADLARLQAHVKALEGRPAWDIVVIQPWGGDDTKNPAAFAANVRILQDEIAKSSPGARVIMYMDPTRRFDSAKQEKSIRAAMEAYRDLARSNQVEVAPAALTGLLVSQERPEKWLKIKKLPNDAHHGLYGAYAVACTIFAAIFDRSPEGLGVRRLEAHYQISAWKKDTDGKKAKVEPFKEHMGYFDDGPVQTISDEDRRLIQAKAWQAWREWKAVVAGKETAAP